MHFYKVYTVLISLLMFICNGICLAEPSAPVRYLMDEPVSMLEWGMFRLSEALTNDKEPTYHCIKQILKEHDLCIVAPYVRVSYDWDSNRLRIKTLVFEKSQPQEISKEKKKEICKLVIKEHKNYLGVNFETGKPISPLGEAWPDSILESFFTHEGFKSTREPENLYKELDNITELIIQYIPVKGKKLHCEAPLLGTDILFSESEIKGRR